MKEPIILKTIVETSQGTIGNSSVKLFVPFVEPGAQSGAQATKATTVISIQSTDPKFFKDFDPSDEWEVTLTKKQSSTNQ